MSFKKTAETLIKGSHTLDQKYYLNKDILDQEYNNIFFKSWICACLLYTSDAADE